MEENSFFLYSMFIFFSQTDSPIKFYGDPLVDFSLTHFLDRFAFKNPKKDNENKPESFIHSFHHKNYTPHGSRGKSVKQLSSTNCTEDEKFIFEYLNRKRERQAAFSASGAQKEVEAVDDDEFEAYLDGLSGKKNKKDGTDDEEFDFLGDFGDGKNNENGNDDAEDWDTDDDNEDEDDDDDDDDGDVGMKDHGDDA